MAFALADHKITLTIGVWQISGRDGNFSRTTESCSQEVSMSDGKHTPQIIELVEQFAELLYRYAYRLTGNAADAEDLTQQTFLQAQQRRHQLRDSSAAKGWLCSIMRNAFLTSRRHRGKRQALESVENSLCAEEPAEPLVDSGDLQRALLELSEEFRSPLILFYFEEFSYQGIADHMGLPIGTVMSRLSRAKAFLRQRLQENPGVDGRSLQEKVAT
jgi:RNA polymerase sigma-70 factor (ECF subfamily)